MSALRLTVTAEVPRPAQLRRLSVLLFAALLPMLSYAGHWDFQLHVPGIESTERAEDAHVHHHEDGAEGEAHRHSEHCHGGAASCSDVPFAGASAFALAGQAIAVLGSEGRLLALAVLAWAPHGGEIVAPELRPPRGARPFA